MTSVDGLHRHAENDNRQNSDKDEFLEYYQKHRPPGAAPAGYNFKRFCKMDHGTSSLPGSLYGEVGEHPQFSEYRHTSPAAHNSTLSPSNSITEDDDYEVDKPGNFAWSTSSQISVGSGTGAVDSSYSTVTVSKPIRPQQRKPLDRKTWYAKFVNSLKRSSSKKKGLPPSGHSLDTAKNRYQQIDRSGTGESGIYRSESCRQMTAGSEYEYGSCYSSFDEPLSGMLGDKMKFGNNSWYAKNVGATTQNTYSRSRCFLPTGDSFDNDSQSRDSGHSSGGISTYNNTPRGTLLPNSQRGKLPIPPGQQVTTQHISDAVESVVGVEREDYGSLANVNDTSSTHNSIYSYATARAPDEEDSAVGSSSTFSHYNGNWYGKRYNSQTTTYDSMSLASGSAASSTINNSAFYDNRSAFGPTSTSSAPWTQDENGVRQRRNPSLSWIASSSASGTFYSAKGKRKLDSLDEDDTSSFEVESNTDIDQHNQASSQKRQCSPFKRNQESSNSHDASQKRGLNLLFYRLLYCLFALLKFCMMAILIVLVILGSFYALRTYTCNLARDTKVNIPLLKQELSENVFGQQYAIKSITNSIKSFYEGTNGPSVLVLLLLGSTGTGKTLTSSLIRQHFPVASSNSYFFSVPMHFNHLVANNNNIDILWDVASHIQRNCGHSLVLFDDLDADFQNSNSILQNQTMRHIINFSSNLKNNIYGKTLPSAMSQVQSTNSNGTIIVITTTSGADEINLQTVEMTRESAVGSIPQATQLDMERVIKSSSELEHFRDMLMSRGVSLSLVPFMPLSRTVVRKCIMNDIKSRFPNQGDFAPPRKIVDNLLHELKYFSDEFPVFSTSGCKTVTSKLDILLEDLPNPPIGGLMSDGF